MISSFLRSLNSALKTRRSLARENLALRQQLAVLHRSVKRSRLSVVDRGFWVLCAESGLTGMGSRHRGTVKLDTGPLAPLRAGKKAGVVLDSSRRGPFSSRTTSPLRSSQNDAPEYPHDYREAA